MPHRYCTRKLICQEIDITLTNYDNYRRKGTYRGIPMPKISQKRGWIVLYDREEAAVFIRKVRQFHIDHMNTKEASEYLGVSSRTLVTAAKTNSVLGCYLESPVKFDKQAWWRREAVIECRKNIEEVRDYISCIGAKH